MHRFSHSAPISRFRLSSFLLWVLMFLIPAAVAVFIYSVFAHVRLYSYIAIGMIFLAVFLRVIQWFLASRAKCPLCMVPSLSNRGCAKNRNARKLFGSYRLRVAGTILLRNYFRCPYCGEPTVMELRQRKTHLIHSK